MTVTLSDEQAAALAKLLQPQAPAAAQAQEPAPESNGQHEAADGHAAPHTHTFSTDSRGRYFCTDASCGERYVKLEKQGTPDMMKNVFKALNDVGHEGHSFLSCPNCRAEFAKDVAASGPYQIKDDLDFKNKSGRFTIEFKR